MEILEIDWSSWNRETLEIGDPENWSAWRLEIPRVVRLVPNKNLRELQ